MVEFTTLLLDLAVIIMAAEVGGIVFHWLKLPRVLGMLVAGIALSPFTPGYQVQPADVELLAQLGGVFLMFGIGLTFNLTDLRRIGTRALLLCVNAAAVSFLLGYAVAVGLGWDRTTALFAGVMLMSTSTLVSVRMMQDLGLVALRGADVAIASVVLDDLLALLAMTAVLGYTGLEAARPGGLALGIALLIAVVGIVVLLASRVLPPALAFMERISPQSTVLIAMSGCFLLAFLFAAASLPPLVGAFFAGTVIASTAHGERVRKWIDPISILFTGVFFTAVGLLIDPALLRAVAGPALLLLGAAIVGKFLGGFATLASLRTPLYPAAMLAMLLVPRGEVALIVAEYGAQAGADPALRALAALLMIGTTLFTPLGARFIRGRAAALDRLSEAAAAKREAPPEGPPPTARPEGPSETRGGAT